MDSSGPTLDSPPDRVLDRFQALLEVLLLSGLVSGFVAALPFLVVVWPRAAQLLHSAGTVTGYALTEAAVTLALLIVVLRSRGESLKDIGLRRHNWRSHVLVGIGLVPMLFLIGTAVAVLFRVFLPSWFTDRNPLLDTIRTPGDLVLFLLTAVLVGGLKEELQRGFIITRFSRYLGGAALGLAVWSLVFGLGHYVQGPQGIVTATLFGVLFGAVYIARKNLVAPIVAHALYDIVALVGFWFTRPGIR